MISPLPPTDTQEWMPTWEEIEQTYECDWTGTLCEACHQELGIPRLTAKHATTGL